MSRKTVGPTTSVGPKPGSGRPPAEELARIAEDIRGLAVPLASVRPDPANARVHGERNLEAIRLSLRRYGQRKPIVVNAETGLIEAGNGAWEAARREGWGWIAAVRVRDEPGAAAGYAVADNRTAELAEWDEAKLAELLRGLRKAGELVHAGFEERELRALTDRLARAAAGPDDGFRLAEAMAAAPDLAAKAAPGMTWRLGRHLLACADSTDPAQVRRVLADAGDPGAGRGVDVVVTDPPYAIYGSSTGVGPDITDDRIVRPFFESLLRRCFDALPLYGHAYVFCDWRSWPGMWEASRRAGMTARNLIVWDKGASGLGSNYANCYELVGFFAKLPPPRGIGDVRPAGGKAVLRPNLQRFPRPAGDEKRHMAAKPVGLYEEFIRNSAEDGGTVFDPFCGSGTVFVAAERTGRRAVGIDVDPKWCVVSVARWEALTGQSAVAVAAPDADGRLARKRYGSPPRPAPDTDPGRGRK